MSAGWITMQLSYAAVSWSISAGAVYRAAFNAGTAGPGLEAAIESLTARPDRESAVASFAGALGEGPVRALLDGGYDDSSAEQWALRVDRAQADYAVAVRTLRGLATMGTTLGLLAAIATMRAGLEAPHAEAVRTVANAAFDSAVLGFVSALPCWAALALARTHDRRTYQSLGRAAVALARHTPSR